MAAGTGDKHNAVNIAKVNSTAVVQQLLLWLT